MSTLLAGGASPHHRDRAGDTPLLYVRNLLKEHLYSPAFTVASLLLGAGAEVDDANNDVRGGERCGGTEEMITSVSRQQQAFCPELGCLLIVGQLVLE